MVEECGSRVEADAGGGGMRVLGGGVGRFGLEFGGRRSIAGGLLVSNVML